MSRAVDGTRLDKSLVEAINQVLDRAEAVAGLGVAKSKADRKVLSDAWDLHWAALVSARNALQGLIDLNPAAVPPLYTPASLRTLLKSPKPIVRDSLETPPALPPSPAHICLVLRALSFGLASSVGFDAALR